MSHRRLILKADPRVLIMKRTTIELRRVVDGTIQLHRVTENVRFDSRKETAFTRNVD